MEIPPYDAASMSLEVYGIKSESMLSLFLGRPEFSNASVTLKGTVGARLVNTKDSFGVCARGAGQYKNDLFLVFRGSTASNFMADWVSNARIGVTRSETGQPVHLGFNHIFTSMLPQIRDFVSQHPGVTGDIHCLGHSLGGAVASLAADWLRAHRPNKVRLYTFGAPKPGMEGFASALTRQVKQANIHRVYHTTDPVPMVPVYPFMHAPNPGAGYAISSEELLVTAGAHDIRKYRDSVKTQTWLSLGKPALHAYDDSLVERWLSSDQSVNPASARTWEWINSGLMYVLKKVLHGVAVVVQAPMIGLVTLADRIAWVLRQGLDLAANASRWVLRLMRKIMQALGMAAAATLDQLTQAFMRNILIRLMHRMTAEASRAIRSIRF